MAAGLPGWCKLGGGWSYEQAWGAAGMQQGTQQWARQEGEDTQVGLQKVHM